MYNALIILIIINFVILISHLNVGGKKSFAQRLNPNARHIKNGNFKLVAIMLLALLTGYFLAVLLSQ